MIQIGSADQVHFHRWDSAVPPKQLCQLPFPAQDFVNRASERATLTDLFHRPEPAAVTSALTGVLIGPPGVGKSELMNQVATGLKEQFPDGQVYVRLSEHRGTGGAIDLNKVLRVLLRALGVADQAMPESTEELGSLYRSQLHSRKVLVVVDDAELASQALALAPGQGGGLLVTSRLRLPGLRGSRTVVLPLEPLSVDESVELIGHRIGEDRVAAEPEQARALAELCSRLPVLLCAISESLANRPHRSLAAVVAQLTDTVARSKQFEHAGAFAVLDESIGELGETAARIYRVLALMPGVHLTVEALAAVLGLSLADAANALDELDDVNLLEGLPGDRYVPHSMIRVHATYLAEKEFSPEERTAITRRAVDWYLACGQIADRKAGANRLRLPGPAPEAPFPLLEFTDESKALAWLELSYSELIDCVRIAAEHQWNETVWLFCDPLWVLNQHHKHYDGWLKSLGLAIEAARRAGNGWVTARLEILLARAYTELKQFDRADESLASALELARIEGDAQLEASVLEFMGVSRLNSGQFQRALELFGQGRKRLESAQDTLDRSRADLLLRYLSGRAYLGLGDLAAAIEILTSAYPEAVEASRISGDTRTPGRIRLYLADALLSQGDTESARSYAVLAVDEAKRRGVAIERIDALELLARCHEAVGEVDEAARRRAEAQELRARSQS